MNLTTAALTALLCVGVAIGQRKAPPSKAELAQITERGRQLAQYDVAVWYASDAVVATKPTEGSVARYIAKKDGAAWTVMFGRLNDKRDRFLIAYEATQGASPKEFAVKKNDPPKEDTGFFLFAAKAVETSLADFKGAARPYNVAVLPASSNQIYVYAVPAQTKEGVSLWAVMLVTWFLRMAQRFSKTGSYTFQLLNSPQPQMKTSKLAFTLRFWTTYPKTRMSFTS